MEPDNSSLQSTPLLSIVIIVYNMTREAPRSLYSLSAEYQNGICPEDYEVIVVDNGSDSPMSEEQVTNFGTNFQYLTISQCDALPSPCVAINHGVSVSRGSFVGIMIDGARIASPGAISLALDALQRFDRAVVATIGFHLGPAMQTWAVRTGYDENVEDNLPNSIGWPDNGYQLFSISALTGVNNYGWLGTMAESNLIFLSRDMFDEINGFDVQFDLPGGELANLDFYNRATSLPNSTLISLFGEATFHQIHGGVMSSKPGENVVAEVTRYKDRFLAIRGLPFEPSTRTPTLYGPPRHELFPCLENICRTDRLSPGETPTRIQLDTRQSTDK
jgi:glycosyltransferase involved in cell wall biosynthesis